MALGSGLLNLSTWIRRQPWLRAVYRHFPSAVRMRTAQALATYVSERVRFERTPNWKRRPDPSEFESTGSAVLTEFGEAIGVNIFACIRGQFGLAEGARLYARALLAEGYPVAIHNIDIDIPHGMDDASFDSHIGEILPHGVNLIFVNPDHLEQAINSIGHSRMGSRYTIACWFWELERFPDEWLPALKLVDEVMVSTGFIEAAVKRVTEKPVWHVPLPVSGGAESGLMRADFGLEEDSFVFLNTFDFNSFLPRKNPQAVIDAFRMAFGDGRQSVKLLIKSSNGHRYPSKLQELLKAADIDRRIIIRDEIIDRADVRALQRCADAYVSLHRAEGFGLGLAECMYMGKPVIATAWSGNMEFMTAQNSCLVDYKLVPVGEGEYIHHAQQRWAEPSIAHAAEQMRRLVEDREYASRLGAQAALDIRNKLSPHEVALQIIRRNESFSTVPAESPRYVDDRCSADQ
ncbi:MAG: glycosyltransferase family 4 protein [Xanthomonadaceae bacterium]|jgi:glycosyltransferase involved in cell wall biosynthesis|nr:glycosyltransferase family 4 protein [Xanthomonadaceae bacterium]